MQTESAGAAPAITETSSLTDAETIEALQAKNALLAASLKQAEHEADELRSKLLSIGNVDLVRELRRCSSFIDCARLAVKSTQLYECDEASDVLLEVQNRLYKAVETLDLAQEIGGAASFVADDAKTLLHHRALSQANARRKTKEVPA